VVVYRYSKIVRYIPYSVDITAEEIRDILIEEVFSKYRLLESIISDRGSILTL